MCVQMRLCAWGNFDLFCFFLAFSLGPTFTSAKASKQQILRMQNGTPSSLGVFAFPPLKHIQISGLPSHKIVNRKSQFFGIMFRYNERCQTYIKQVKKSQSGLPT